MFGNTITKDHLVGAAVGVGVAAIAFYIKKIKLKLMTS